MWRKPGPSAVGCCLFPSADDTQIKSSVLTVTVIKAMEDSVIGLAHAVICMGCTETTSFSSVRWVSPRGVLLRVAVAVVACFLGECFFRPRPHSSYIGREETTLSLACEAGKGKAMIGRSIS